jgi:hypothetical protein
LMPSWPQMLMRTHWYKNPLLQVSYTGDTIDWRKRKHNPLTKKVHIKGHFMQLEIYNYTD